MNRGGVVSSKNTPAINNRGGGLRNGRGGTEILPLPKRREVEQVLAMLKGGGGTEGFGGSFNMGI